MKKLIRVIVICAIMLSLMIAQMTTVYAGSAVISVAADRTEAEAGETVNFTVSLSPVSDLGSMLMKLDIPEGLTYVKESGKLADGLKSKLGFDMLDFTEKSLIINGVASAADYSSSSDTVICTFSCTVDNGFKGNAEVGLTNLEFLSCKTWEDHTGDYSVSSAVISVGKDSGQGSQAEQGGTSDSGKSSDSSASTDTGKSSGSSGSNGSQDQSESTASGDQADSSDPQSGESAQPAGSDSQASDDTKAETAGDAAGDAANTGTDKAEEEQNSVSVWLIALIAVLLIAAVLAVIFKKRKRH